MTEEEPPRRSPRFAVRFDGLTALKGAPVTIGLMLACAALFVTAELSGSTSQVGTLLRFGADEQTHVRCGEPWRLVTSMFLHIGWIHFLWNGYFSFSWCAAVEHRLGRWKFLALYLASGVAGAAASSLSHPVVSAGASGAVFGVIGATLIVRYRDLGSVQAFFEDRGVRRVLVMAAIWTALGSYALNIDNWAHGGGFVAGLLFAWAMTGQVRVAYALPVALLLAAVVAAVRPWAPLSPTEASRAGLFAVAYAKPEDGFTLDRGRAKRFATRACEAGNNGGCAIARFMDENPGP